MGVYYGATFIESQLCAGEEVAIVGGGNAAGQAAVFLAQTARRVHMVIRSDGLADTMSRYLIRRIEESDAITLHTNTEVTALSGRDHLETLTWLGRGAGTSETRSIRHVFVMTGAAPSTAGSKVVSCSISEASSKPARIFRWESWLPRAGHWRGVPTSWKQVVQSVRGG